MIVFTGSGAIAEAYAGKYPCRIISARQLNDQDLQEELSNASLVIHNAAAINAAGTEDYVQANFDLTRRVVDNIRKVSPALPLMYLGSMSVLNSDLGYRPPYEMNDYSWSKWLAETYLLRLPALNASVVRFATLFYGDAKRDGLSNLAWQAATEKRIRVFNAGTATREWLPVDIAVSYLHKLTTRIIPAQKKCWNIGTGLLSPFAHFAVLAQSQVPGVIVEDLAMKNGWQPAVLGDSDIRTLGKIDFDIDQYFTAYLSRCLENTDL